MVCNPKHSLGEEFLPQQDLLQALSYKWMTVKNVAGLSFDEEAIFRKELMTFKRNAKKGRVRLFSSDINSSTYHASSKTIETAPLHVLRFTSQSSLIVQKNLR